MAQVGDIVKLNFKSTYRTSNLKKLLAGNHLMLITDVNGNEIRISPISSNMVQTQHHESNVPIIDWQQAGLNKPSYVDVSTRGKVDVTSIHSHIGRVGRIDMRNIRRILGNTKLRRLIEHKYNTGYPEYLDYTVDFYGNRYFLM